MGRFLSWFRTTTRSARCAEVCFNFISTLVAAYSLIGVGAGKFLEMRRIFAQIFTNLPEKIQRSWPPTKTSAFHWVHLFKSRHFKHHFCPNFSYLAQKQLSSNMTSKKKLFTFILDAIFVKSTHIQEFCAGLHIFCPNFLTFCPDFHQIKTFGGCGCTPASYISVWSCCKSSGSLANQIIFICRCRRLPEVTRPKHRGKMEKVSATEASFLQIIREQQFYTEQIFAFVSMNILRLR